VYYSSESSAQKCHFKSIIFNKLECKIKCFDWTLIWFLQYSCLCLKWILQAATNASSAVPKKKKIRRANEDHPLDRLLDRKTLFDVKESSVQFEDYPGLAEMLSVSNCLVLLNSWACRDSIGMQLLVLSNSICSI